MFFLDQAGDAARKGPARSRRPLRIGMVSTYSPTRCGIARFSENLVRSVVGADPGVEFGVVRLISEPVHPEPAPPVALTIDPRSRMAVRNAARVLDRFDVVLIQHEYGIFGDGDGEAVTHIVDEVQRPMMTVLHTVLPAPGPDQRRIVEHLARRTHLVVMCESARTILGSRYGIRRDQVSMILHGSHWRPQPANQPPRRRLITWGLLGPGKGLERSIAAVAALRHLHPPVSYRIVGRTHPTVLRREGNAYRRSLESLVRSLGLERTVHFVDRYVQEEELLRMVRASDLVVVPYDNDEQMTSGVVTDSLAAGRPVVATRFPYAVEMLQDGAGATVGHDSGEIAGAVAQLLDDDDHYVAAAAAASTWSPVLSWRSVAERYLGLLVAAATEEATA